MNDKVENKILKKETSLESTNQNNNEYSGIQQASEIKNSKKSNEASEDGKIIYPKESGDIISKTVNTITNKNNNDELFYLSNMQNSAIQNVTTEELADASKKEKMGIEMGEEIKKEANESIKNITEILKTQNIKLNQILNKVQVILENNEKINFEITKNSDKLINVVEKKYEDQFESIESIEEHLINQLKNLRKIEQIVLERGSTNQNLLIGNNDTLYSQKGNIEMIIPIIDSIEILVKSLDKKQKNQFKFLNNILRQIESQFDLKLIRSVKGEAYDERKHLVVQMIDDIYPKNAIIESVRSGIEYKGKLLRSAEVIISSGKKKKKRKYLLF